MLLLGIDTCGPLGGVALGEADGSGGIEVVAAREIAGKTFGARLVPTVREILGEAERSLEEVRGVAVVSGPGSFTGIRIGMSAAKGFGEGLGIPVVAVSRLELLAGRVSPDSDRVCAVLDAGRGEFYVRMSGADGEAVEAMMSREELLLAAEDMRVAICEEGLAGIVAEPLLVAAPNAADALRFAARRLVAGDSDDVAGMQANYLRRPDAELFAKMKAVSAVEPGPLQRS